MVDIRQAAEFLGVSTITLRRWEERGKLIPERTKGGHRRYDLATLCPNRYNLSSTNDKLTIAYARVSSHDQKDELERQKQVLEVYCANCGWTFSLISDLGSGMNYYKKGLTKLLNMILKDEIGRLVVTHQARLLRFGAELVFAICAAKGVEIVIINKGEEVSFEEDLAKDVLEIITVIPARTEIVVK